MAATHQESLGDQNRAFFNTHADTVYQHPWVHELCEKIELYMRQNVSWLGVEHLKEDGRLLDYACGMGLVSSALAPWVKTLRGIDISDNMVKHYNLAAEKQGFSKDRMFAVQGDLTTEPPKGSPILGPDYFDCDIVVICMALHHIQEPEKLIKRLAERVANGGSLVVIDWKPSTEMSSESQHAAHSHPTAHTISRSGFEEDEIRDMLTSAGLLEPRLMLYPGLIKFPAEVGGGERQLFFMRAVKGTRLEK